MAKSSPKKSGAPGGAGKGEAKDEARRERGLELKPEGKTESKSAGKPVVKAGKAEAKADLKPGAKTVAKSEPKGEPKVEKGETRQAAAEAKAVKPAEARAAAPAPVANGKPPRNQAGLKSQELEAYRKSLLEKRHELVGDMGQMEREALQRGGSSNLSNLPLHMADMGTDNYEQEFTLNLMEKDRDLVREINAALGRIHEGTFGICEGTGKPIGKPRLEAQPWARYSIEHARKMEKRMGR